MKSHYLTEDYRKAFRAFLDHTSEKRDLLAVLMRRIAAVKANSLLDIGAGNGDLAAPLSALVKTYVAVEPNPGQAVALRDRGLTVIESAFPTRITQSFDVVLASHVVPWEEGKGEAFLAEAWKCVHAGGALIVITYEDEASPWRELLAAARLPVVAAARGHVAICRRLMTAFGEPDIEPVVTHVETDSLDDMTLALSFVYSDGRPDMTRLFLENGAVRDTLGTRYLKDGRYRFPFTHYLVQAIKGG